MRLPGVIIVVCFCALLIYGVSGLPPRGSKTAPHQREEGLFGSATASSYYIKYSLRDARTPNMVTAVLGDYRGFDTLGEVLVVLTAGLCCMLILKKKDE